MLYVVRTPTGGLRQVHEGCPFNTHLIKIREDEVDYHRQPMMAPPDVGSVIEYELSHSSNALELWQDEDFERCHVYKVAEPATNIPPGERIKGYTFTETDGVIGAVALFEPIPPPDQVPNHQLLTQLSKIYFDQEKQNGYEKLTDFLNSPACPLDVKIYWNHSQIYERLHPKVKFVFRIHWCMGQDWIDQLFYDAAQQS